MRSYKLSHRELPSKDETLLYVCITNNRRSTSETPSAVGTKEHVTGQPHKRTKKQQQQQQQEQHDKTKKRRRKTRQNQERKTSKNSKNKKRRGEIHEANVVTVPGRYVTPDVICMQDEAQQEYLLIRLRQPTYIKAQKYPRRHYKKRDYDTPPTALLCCCIRQYDSRKCYCTARLYCNARVILQYYSIRVLVPVGCNKGKDRCSSQK